MRKGVVIYSVACKAHNNDIADFMAAVAYITEGNIFLSLHLIEFRFMLSCAGRAIPLNDAKLLSNVVLGTAREEVNLDKLIPDVASLWAELQNNNVFSFFYLSPSSPSSPTLSANSVRRL
jgi:hypothetical protein